MKIIKKFEQYQVKQKCYCFRVIKFPPIEKLWLYDAHPSESTYDAQGNITGMHALAEALITALYVPNSIIFLPINKDSTTYNMVLSGREIEGFRPSVWYKIKPHLNNHSKVNDFKLSYDTEKLIKYIERELEKEPSWQWKIDLKYFCQKELGDTIFCKYSKNDILRFILGIFSAIKSVEDGAVSSGWGLGWCLSDDMVDNYNKGVMDTYDNW